MRIRLLFSLFLLVAFPVSAEVIADLYSADVPVTDQGAATRAAAMKDALGQVLVKITGSSAMLEHPVAATLLAKPDRYLQQYRYVAIDPPPVDPAAPRLALHASFDGRALEDAVRAAGVPLWGRERPRTLVWAALDSRDGRQIAGANDAGSISEALQRAAMRRGLPLTLPAMDAEDATRVSFMDIWGTFEEPLLAAAERYAPDAVLVGAVFAAGGELWGGRWTLLLKGERLRFETSGASAEAVAIAAVDELAERYAERFAVSAPLGGEGTITVEISNVRDLRDYAAVQKYLAGLSVVENAQVLEVRNDTLRMALAINATSRALEQTIALGRVLEPETRQQEVIVPLGEFAGIDFAADRTLYYRYRR